MISSKRTLKFKQIVRIAFETLVLKKRRLISTIIIFSIAVFLFGFSFTASVSNGYRAEIKACYKNGIHTITVASNNRYFSMKGGWDTYPLEPKQLDSLKKYNNTYNNGVSLMSCGEIGVDYCAYLPEESVKEFAFDGSPYYFLGMSSGGLIVVDSGTGCEDLNLRPDDRFVDIELCRLPQNETEVAITDLKADMFIRFGYREQDGSITKINTPDDLIGKRLMEYEICGVYSTEISIKHLQQFNEGTRYSLEKNDKAGYYFFQSLAYNGLVRGCCSTVNCAFIKNTPKDKPYTVYLKLGGNLANDMKLFNELNYKGEKNLQKSVEIASPYSSNLYHLNFFREQLSVLFVVISVIFAIIAYFMLISLFIFCSNKIYAEVLQVADASKGDAVAIFLSQVFMFIAAVIIVALVLISIICGIVNATVCFIPAFRLSFESALCTIGFCCGIVVLAIILPLIRIVQKKQLQ